VGSGVAEKGISGNRKRDMPFTRHSSLVDIFSVTNAGYLDQQFGVVDCIHYAVVPDANAPLAVSALHLLAAGGSRSDGKIFDARENAGDDLIR
jgi:hypothetical protein